MGAVWTTGQQPKASDPYDTNNPASQAARANKADNPEQMSTSPSEGEVDQLNAKRAELETQLSAANAAQEPLNAKMAQSFFKDAFTIMKNKLLKV